MKKPGEITITITIGIMFLILTAVIYIQFKTISHTDISSLETMRAEELQDEIAGTKTKYEEIEEKIKETLEKTQEYENTLTSELEASQLLQKELNQVKDLAGLTDVTGQGVIIILSDTNTETSNERISANDLLTLLNELKAAGAEAISINNQRIVYDSYVVDINDTYISVNGVRLISPYVVKAIGNTTYLESGLSQKQYGYLDKKKMERKNVTLEKVDTMTIPKSNLNLEFSYVEEE